MFILGIEKKDDLAIFNFFGIRTSKLIYVLSKLFSQHINWYIYLQIITNEILLIVFEVRFPEKLLIPISDFQYFKLCAAAEI